MLTQIEFQTCTLMEAIEEINIMLQAADAHKINEDDLISTFPIDKHDPDDFDDYRFVFKYELKDDEDIEKLRNTGLTIGC